MRLQRIRGLKPAVALLILLVFGMRLTPVQLAQRYDEYANQPIAEINIDMQITALAMSVHPIAAISTVNGVRLYDADLDLLAQFRTDKAIRGVAWNPDGTALAITVDNTIEIWNWDAATHTPILDRTLPASGFPLNVTWSPDGARIAGMTIADLTFQSHNTQIMTIEVWNTTTWEGFSYPDPYLIYNTDEPQNALTWNPYDPTQLVGVGQRARFEDGRAYVATNVGIFVTNRDTGEVIKDIELGEYAILSATWQPSGNSIAVASEVGSVGIFDAITGERTAIYAMSSDFIGAIDWSPFNGMIVAGNTVVDPIKNIGLGVYTATSQVVGAAWLEDESNYQGLLMMAEKNGRITVQTIEVLQYYTSPTPENWELTVTPTPEPLLPIADAGVDQSVFTYDINGYNTSVQLDGSGSSSPNGAIVKYEWRRNDRAFSATAKPTLCLGFGTHTITLIVTDEIGQQGVDTVTIEVVPVTVTPSLTPDLTPTLTPTFLPTPTGTPPLVFQRSLPGRRAPSSQGGCEG